MKKTRGNDTSWMTSNQQWQRSQQLNKVERSAQDHILGVIKNVRRVAPIIPKELSGDEAQCYGLSTRALKLRILKEVSPKENSRDDQQETLLVMLIDNNIKLARRP
jgi:hypothetical protein